MLMPQHTHANMLSCRAAHACYMLRRRFMPFDMPRHAAPLFRAYHATLLSIMQRAVYFTPLYDIDAAIIHAAAYAAACRLFTRYAVAMRAFYRVWLMRHVWRMLADADAASLPEQVTRYLLRYAAPYRATPPSATHALMSPLPPIRYYAFDADADADDADAATRDVEPPRARMRRHVAPRLFSIRHSARRHELIYAMPRLLCGAII